MKTNRSASWMAKVRIVSLCLALVSIVGIEMVVSQSLASRIGQLSVQQTDAPQASNVSLADLMA
ncbi:MAG: hypothetical protein WCT12_29165, partial [Verrucomicrobiota bacterium]